MNYYLTNIICIHVEPERQNKGRQRSWVLLSQLSGGRLFEIQMQTRKWKRKQQPLSNQNRCHQDQCTHILTNYKTNKVPKKLSYQVFQIMEQCKPYLSGYKSDLCLGKQINRKEKENKQTLSSVLRAWKQNSAKLRKISNYHQISL